MQVVAGSADLGCTVAMAQEIVDGIADARLTVLGAAHVSVLEQPAGFASALQDLLGRLG